MGRKSYNKGRWQVERERFRIENHRPPEGIADPLRISDAMAGVMKKLGLEDTHWLTVLEDEWQKIAGEAVAKHTRPGRMEKKRLTVFVDSSVWLNELLRYGRRQMLLNLQNRFGKGKITSVSLVLDPDDRSERK
ncbi:MAG: DUF721 domain-containing protein [Kiritimatiellae bacterium]|nr:DUF721 domain-containing protein [Kiritimatiellia bacterium]MDD5520041.1 DUF721 domain-containing protein [Kiritimatiellia bacterium]